ncbi:PLP-dependent aminotransferase family protein [Clostridium paridis]|uniref:PLP-dependent aminotransferase family protein n=1 Tax=Clostridium paridis TaxID=2803863 RepID=A0A937K417_9CLOT|nr:PLP-dependent aminotransferase family protein [Clostridium paridis]MBL4932187.1 PLP-dependent aminotransferase family protein [Clostridium paridis]
MKEFSLIFHEEIPKYIQLSDYIKHKIDIGEIKDREKLPTIRALSEMLKVNNVTIVNAYKKLQADGYANMKIGSGTYARRKEVIRSFNKEYNKTFKLLSSGGLREYIDFTGETTSSSFFPVKDLQKVINEVFDRDGAEALLYQDVLGYEKLREEISKRFWKNKYSSEDILIVSGAQQGIDIAAKAILNVNDKVIVERPTYGGAISVFRWKRADILEVPIENDGIDIAILEKILKKQKIKFMYIMSYFQNPTGISYSEEKKKKLIALAEKYDFYILEDDYLSELIYDSNLVYNPLKSYDIYDRVIYIKSFSKIFMPGIRIGYVIIPEVFKDSMYLSKINTDISTSSLMQRALERYIVKGYWRKHIEYLNEKYRSRYTFIKQILERDFKGILEFKEPNGGLSFLLKFSEPEKFNSRKLFFILRDKGVLISPGALFFRKEQEGDKYFRIGFSQTNHEKIKEGLNIILKELSL